MPSRDILSYMYVHVFSFHHPTWVVLVIQLQHASTDYWPMRHMKQPCMLLKSAMVRLLLEARADQGLAAQDGNTALQGASRRVLQEQCCTSCRHKNAVVLFFAQQLGTGLLPPWPLQST